jgi:hypothetical protein
VQGELGRAGSVGGNLGRAAEGDDVQAVGLGEDLVVLARERDYVEAARGQGRLQRPAHECAPADPGEVLPRNS